MLLSGGFYALFVWWPTYLIKIVHPPIAHALLVNTIAMIVLMGVSPLAGLLSDVVGRRAVLVSGMLGVLVVAYPLTVWTDHSSFTAALVSQIIFAVFVAGALGPVPAAMAEMFPTRNRYSAVALAYNVTVGWVGGTAPLVCTWAATRAGDIAAPAYYLIVLGVVSMVAALGVQSKLGEHLE
jgi:MHS family proline/betaine transporter-like MFS transporter